MAAPELNQDAWTSILEAVTDSRDAAAMACAFRAANDAYAYSKWPRSVRIARNEDVHEPASGTFHVVVRPGEPVQAAVDRCPRGGCVLLMPGTHEGPLVLAANKEVHVFGRGQATLQTRSREVVTSKADKSTLDGLTLRFNGTSADYSVWIIAGHLRLQNCDISNAAAVSVWIQNGADPLLKACRIHNGANWGVCLDGAGTRGRMESCDVSGNKFAGVQIMRGADAVLADCKIHNEVNWGVQLDAGGRARLERCDIWSNGNDGVCVENGGDAELVACTIRDHPTGWGVRVDSDSRATVGQDCVFDRNAKGDIIRDANDADDLMDEEAEEEEEEEVN